MSTVVESWVSLSIAIFFGVLGTTQLKLSHGLTNKKHTIYLAIFYAISFVAMTFAMKYLELSIVYAVWSGAGTLLITAVGFLHFDEKISIKKIIFLILIVFGVIGIHGIF
jgi:small multidrug resistance pump